MFKTVLLVAPLALSTAAFAGPTHFTDAQYIAAARCQALISSPALGRQDTRGVDSVLKMQSSSRSVAVSDRADQAREDAERAARHAGAYGKSQLIAERDGACQVYTGGGTVSAAVAPAGPTRTN